MGGEFTLNVPVGVTRTGDPSPLLNTTPRPPGSALLLTWTSISTRDELT